MAWNLRRYLAGLLDARPVLTTAAELAQRAADLRDDHPPFRRRDGEDAALSALPCAGLFEFSNTIIAMMHVAW